MEKDHAENEPLIRGDPPAGAIPGALGEPRGLLAALGEPPRDPNGEMPRLGELRLGEPCADADKAFVELPDRAVSVAKSSRTICCCFCSGVWP